MAKIKVKQVEAALSVYNHKNVRLKHWAYEGSVKKLHEAHQVYWGWWKR